MINSSDSSKSLDSLNPKVERLIDANINRLKEGLRVVEDICRYIHNDRNITSKIKELRHKLQAMYSTDRLKYRDVIWEIYKKKSTKKANYQEKIIESVVMS